MGSPPPPDPDQLPPDCQTIACQKKNKPQLSYGPVLPTATGGPDHFGYTWNDGYTMASWSGAWTDLTTGGVRIWDGSDVESDLIQQVNLPFSFKFYERAYNKVYISSNGIIGFDDSVSPNLAVFRYYPVPHDYKSPQNFVAPYWTDLKYVEAYHSGSTTASSDGHGNFFAVEWFQSTDSDELATLTFEVKLYENGDIAYIYHLLTAAPTAKSIGIEDPDGVDGLQYLINTSGPSEDQVILFERPDPARRVKLFPLLQSEFNIDRFSTFTVKLRNPGDLTPEPQSDIFNLQASSSDPDWTVSLYGPDGYTPLINHDSNLLPDSNSLVQGANFTVTVKVTAPVVVNVGERATVTLTASSSQDPSKTALVQLVSVVPAPFAHAYKNLKDMGSSGFNLELVSPSYRINKLVNPHYTGASNIMNGLAGDRYISMWEDNVSTGTNLEYWVVNSIGNDEFNDFKVIQDNEGQSRQDILPVTATAPNGKLGVAWIRKEIVDGAHYKENVYLAILNPQATQILSGPLNVTGDTTIYDLYQYSYIYRDVAIAATGDNNFYLSWRKYNDMGGGAVTQEIYHAVHDSSGAVIKAKERLTTPASKVENVRPALIAYLDGQEKVLLAFFQTNSNFAPPTNKILYTVRSSSGAQITPIAEFYQLGQQYGSGLDGVDLKDGRLAVAWVNHAQGRVNYVIMGTDLARPASPNVLENPDNALGWREANFVSITTGGAGKAILTWLDNSFKERIYYALVDDNGPTGIVTPPMVFRYLQPGVERELDVYGAYGNAAYIPIWRIMLPLVKR